MPWKNGGGTTWEVLRLPAGADLDDFDVRISFAAVEEGGPFSAFPGIDRVIALVRGDRLVLDVDGTVHDLGRFEPLAFPGEAMVTSTITEPSLDVNVMTRRGVHDADVAVHRLAGGPVGAPAGSRVLVLSGRADVDGTALDELDVAGPLAAPATVSGDGAVVMVVVLAADD